MKKLFAILVLIIVSSAVSAQRGNVGQGQSVAPTLPKTEPTSVGPKEFSVPGLDFFVGQVNTAWQASGSPLQVVSQEMTARKDDDGKLRNAWGRFTMKCPEGSNLEANVTTSLSGEEILPGTRAALVMGGWDVTRNVADGLLLVNSWGIERKVNAVTVLSEIVSGVCTAPDYKAKGYYVAISLWTKKSEARLMQVRVSKQKFEWLKKE